MYATVEVLDAETRLLDASRSLDGPAVDPAVAEQALQAEVPGEGHPLSGDQRDAVRAVVTSPRVVDVLVGAAGTGKTAAMRGVPGGVGGAVRAGVGGRARAVRGRRRRPRRRRRHPHREHAPSGSPTPAPPPTGWPSWTGSGRRCGGPAPPGRPGPCATARECWRPSCTGPRCRPGRLVIVDEASMAATADLDAITTHAREAGAKVLLVGDWAQLSPVGAGGAFRLLATDRDDTPTLHDVRRFRHEWERTASVQLRAGDPTAVDTYISRGRVEGGDRESMLDLLHDAWATDVRAGRTSIMVASDAQTVTDLNDRARATRVRAGEVTSAGVPLASGSTAGVGDLVVTRRNHRGLTTGASWVKNGDQWTVTAVHPDGSLDATRVDGRGRATLPAAYVARHVDLGYATTAHRAQGRTVDTAHAYVTATTLREPLYVMATRGREPTGSTSTPPTTPTPPPPTPTPTTAPPPTSSAPRPGRHRRRPLRPPHPCPNEKSLAPNVVRAIAR